MAHKPSFSQSRLEECIDEDLNFEKCPECDEEYDSSQGVAMHYGYNHKGSLKYLFRCKECKRLKFGHGQKNTFCSKWCEIYEKVGTFKHFDEEFLTEQIVEEGKRAVDVAEEIGVKPDNIHKWVREYEIGDEYECPSCEKSFATKQGVSKHHSDHHNESISGSEYICDNCDEKNWTPKSRNHPKFPKYCDDECFGESMQGEDNPNKDSERKQKISNGLIRAYSEGRKKAGHLKSIDVEETGHTVDSSWEEEVDILLHNSDIEYHYNGRGEYKRYDIDGFTHAPDFIIPHGGKDIVLEVKGSIVMFFQNDKMQKIGEELSARNDVKYIVYGDVDLECNQYVQYGNEKELLKAIRS